MAQHRSLQIDLKYGTSTIYSPSHHFNSIGTREYSVISFVVQLVGLLDRPVSQSFANSIGGQHAVGCYTSVLNLVKQNNALFRQPQIILILHSDLNGDSRKLKIHCTCDVMTSKLAASVGEICPFSE